MTTERMRSTDLRRWNLVQGVMLRRLNLETDVNRIQMFASWFARTVDQQGRLPRYAEVEVAMSHLSRTVPVSQSSDITTAPQDQSGIQMGELFTRRILARR